MATSLALEKVLISSALLPNSLRRLAASASHPAASRLFNTNADRPDVWTRGLDRVGRLADLGSGNLPMSHVLETKDELCVWMDMPGLAKENVKITMDQKHNALLIQGKQIVTIDLSSSIDLPEWDPKFRSFSRCFSSSIDLPEKLCKTDQIKAEMKNGVLKVVMPKVKEEERSDVFHVQVADPESGLGLVWAGVVVWAWVGLVLGLGWAGAGLEV